MNSISRRYLCIILVLFSFIPSFAYCSNTNPSNSALTLSAALGSLSEMLRLISKLPQITNKQSTKPNPQKNMPITGETLLASMQSKTPQPKS